MPTFYFHIRDGDALIQDPVGSDLPDLDAARREAAAAAREMLADRLKAGGRPDGRQFEIADEDGRVLARVAFRDVLGP